jgi:hypothetical protein
VDISDIKDLNIQTLEVSSQKIPILCVLPFFLCLRFMAVRPILYHLKSDDYHRQNDSLITYNSLNRIINLKTSS